MTALKIFAKNGKYILRLPLVRETPNYIDHFHNTRAEAERHLELVSSSTLAIIMGSKLGGVK